LEELGARKSKNLALKQKLSGHGFFKESARKLESIEEEV
jgi:hypothetical protein